MSNALYGNVVGIWSSKRDAEIFYSNATHVTLGSPITTATSSTTSVTTYVTMVTIGTTLNTFPPILTYNNLLLYTSTTYCLTMHALCNYAHAVKHVVKY